MPIIIPSLNDRIEDIEELIRARLPVICHKLGIEEKKIDPKVVAQLKNHDFKGNVRELENILERSIIICETDTIMIDDLLYIKLNTCEKSNTLTPLTLKEAMSNCERDTIIEALRYSDGDRKNAMNILGIGKTSFYDKLKLYKIK